MDSEQRLHESELRGKEAEKLKNSEILNSAFEAVTANFNKEMISTQSHEFEARDLCWRSIQVVALVRDQIQRHIDTGLLATKELENILNNKEGFLNRTSDPYAAINDNIDTI